MKKTLIKRVLIILAGIAALFILLARIFSFSPRQRFLTQTSHPVYSSKAGSSPVIYEGVFPDNEEVQKMFEEIRGEPVFEHVPANYHVTTLYYPKEPRPEFYGMPVKIHVRGYQMERFLGQDFHITGAEGVSTELEADDPELQNYLDQTRLTWHITASYMTDPSYAEELDYAHAKPVDVTLDGVFGAYCTGDYYCFEKTIPADLENRWSRE